MKEVFTIIEKEGKNPFWLKVGAAWENKDGSLNVYLDALPVNGKLQIREKKEWPDKGQGRSGQGEDSGNIPF